MHFFVHLDQQAEVLELRVELFELVFERVEFLLVQQAGLTIVMRVIMALQLMQFPFKSLIHRYDCVVIVISFHLILQFLFKRLHSLDRTINKHPISGQQTEIEVIVFGGFFEDGLFELFVFFEDLWVDFGGVDDVLGDFEQVFVGLGLGVLGHGCWD